MADGNDYADFLSGCPGATRIQDGSACPGQSGLNITNDGGAEINILDAIGYRLNTTTTAAPQPGTMAMFGLAMAGFVAYRRRQRSS